MFAIKLVMYGIFGVVTGVNGISVLEKPLAFLSILACVTIIDFLSGLDK